MANSAPIEVWHKILKYAIAVPLFFEPDPITVYGVGMFSEYHFEAGYWESERRRNILRRVCQSWNAFLKPYDHRYVCLSDIYDGLIRTDAISMAIRLNINPDVHSHPDIQGLFSGMSALLRSYIAPDGIRRHLINEWKLEILDGASVMDPAILAKWLEDLPHLRAVTQPTYAHGDKVMPRGAGLRLLYTEPTWTSASTEPFAFQHLTTLLLAAVPLTLSFKTWRLPSLRHLSIKVFGPRRYIRNPFDSVDADAFTEKMLEIVRHLGKNLITLHYQGLVKSCPIPDLWSHIPHVERIQFPYWKGTIIPTGHCVRIVTIPIALLAGFISSKGVAPSPSILEHLPHPAQFPAHNFIIKMNLPWFVALMKRPVLNETPLVETALWLQQYYESIGAKLIDSDEVTLDRYLVFLIQYFWKDHRGQFSSKHTRYAHIFPF